MTEYVSAAKFAEIIGVSRQRVSRAIAAGLLSESVRRKETDGEVPRYEVDVERGKQEWAVKADASRVTHKQASLFDHTPHDHDEEDESDESEKEIATALPRGIPPFAESKAIREAFNARLARIEYEERAGKLVPADTVRLEAAKVARHVRDNLMGLPLRVCAELAHMNEARQIAIYLEAQIADALKGLRFTYDKQ